MTAMKYLKFAFKDIFFTLLKAFNSSSISSYLLSLAELIFSVINLISLSDHLQHYFQSVYNLHTHFSVHLSYSVSYIPLLPWPHISFSASSCRNYPKAEIKPSTSFPVEQLNPCRHRKRDVKWWMIYILYIECFIY